MKPVLLIHLLLLFFSTLPLRGTAQATSSNPVLQSLIVLGNLHELDAKDPLFDQLDEFINQQEGEVIILFAGDFIDKDGLDLNPDKDELAKLNRLMAIGNKQTQLLFLPGDMEWDNGKKNGLKKVKALEEYFANYETKRHHFLTEEGCPGPTLLDIGKTLRIVALNSHWFVHDHKRPEEQDADCDLLTEAEIWEELVDIIREDENRNIVIAAHHPNISYGQYAGYKLAKYHIAPPLIGSFIAGYHQNIGNTRDLSRAGMTAYNQQIDQILERYNGIIYASGHEYDLQVNHKENNYHINSGAIVKKKSSAKGLYNQYRYPRKSFVQVRFLEDGAVDYQVFERMVKSGFKLVHQQDIYASPCNNNNHKIPINENYIPCREELLLSDHSTQTPLAKTGTAIAGKKYKAGLLRRMILGKHYRKTWYTPIENVPYLDMDTTFGGLTVFAKGGGFQTRSVRLKSADGQVFAFRSVDKYPTQKRDKLLMSGIFGDIIQDYTSHHHPYAPLVLNELMAELDIPNPEAKLFLLPDHPALGIYREEFKGMLGWLEKRPKSKKKGRKPYRNADKVKSTAEMNKKLYKDNDNRLDEKSYLTARLLDMWIADWDRHGGNSSYLGYGSNNKMTFYPFSKDRDKALTKMDGVHRIQDWPMLAKTSVRFRKSHYALKALNHKSRNMDRQHLMVFSKADLLKETRAFQEVMTDEVIDNAVSQLPPAVYSYSGPKIAKILKIRRDRMPDLVKDYYKRLARVVHFIGSNKAEIFEIKRLSNNDVSVAMYKRKKNGKKGKLLKERLCKISETKEIHLYGLGNKDEFLIDGQSRKSILIRIIGGKGKDKITDVSKVRGLRKMTKIYDYKQKDKLQKGPETRVAKIPKEISFKMDGFHTDDDFLILPSMAYNKDDGFIFKLSGHVTLQKFNKPDFGRKYNFAVQTSTNGRLDLSVQSKFRYVVGKWDLFAGLHYGLPDYYFPSFFGLGNELIVDPELNNLDYYDNKMQSYDGHIGLTTKFWKNSDFSIAVLAEYHNVNPDSEDELGLSIYDDFPQDIKTTLIGPQLKLDIDFRDDKNFPTKGIQFYATDYTFVNKNIDWKIGGRVESEISSFWTLGAKMPFTLGLRGGGSKSYGKTPFYYQSFLGQTNRLRGFRKNRISGSSTLYGNSELRWHLGTMSTSIVPLHWGIFGFHDIGRAFNKEEGSSKWHQAYGGGFYIIPYKEQFNLVVTLAHSEQETLLFNFGIGFFVR